MSFQAPISVSDVISRISQRKLLLPAIQREFIWGPKKVEWLFDSLLQGYPLGSFLLWEVRDSEAKSQYRYYEFLREFRERFRTHNPEFNTQGHYDFEAVLDGQQRLTALYIGLKGNVRLQAAEGLVGEQRIRSARLASSTSTLAVPLHTEKTTNSLVGAVSFGS